ncbi:MAG: hypothetical protein LBV72_09710 [Tannerella sp.]|nr:hypothetical protein [Tannerella sp.]
MKSKCILIISLIFSVSILFAYGQGDNYPPLTKRDFETEKIWKEHESKAYVGQYLQYKLLSTYNSASRDELREAIFPWNTSLPPAKEVLDLLNNRLILLQPEFAHEQKYIMLETALPESLGDISELLKVELSDVNLTDAGENIINIAVNEGISLSFSSLFNRY